jgi:hypothetical protein
MHGYKFMVSLNIDFDKFQNIPRNCFPHCLTSPLVYLTKTSKHGWVMGKHGRMYVTTTLSMRGGRRWQTSSTIGGWTVVGSFENHEWKNLEP